jgi:uncharacterized protein (TIGR03118 family)
LVLVAVACTASAALPGSVSSADHGAKGGYGQTNLVATWEGYHPQILEPELTNAWGISLRPAGAGGHFWVTANGSGKSFEYVGDVGDVPLSQDEVDEVTVPGPGGEQGTPTGTVFNEKGAGFVISQGDITAPAKFLFCTDNGVVTGWTERKNADGSFDRPEDSVIAFDGSKNGGQYFGMAISPANDRLYLADFGAEPGVVVLDDKYKVVKNAGFESPFEPEYAPFNIQTIGSSIFVAYAAWGEAGEEEPAPGAGRLAEFSPDGKLVAEWDGGRYLNAPWGLAKAPAEGFGPSSGQLLVSNFGDGTVAVLDPASHKAVDFLRRPDGHRVEIGGIWGLSFGNGVSLGNANSLYFAAGPGPEVDGIFGRLDWQDQ